MTIDRENRLISTAGSTQLTPVQAELLEEYKTLIHNLNALSEGLKRLEKQPTSEILEKLRVLERKTAVVFMLIKASVYSVFVEQRYDSAVVDEDGHAGVNSMGY
ncbi:DASH complex subunit Dad3-domain-containing protein [Lipomyces oligophaga]|uniref:DASH complex subunit Dad3-domain-containing protein n=1 Tax=Lipomyces oligophaga TaxID=45792 RepID=UPI0034CFBBF7